MIARFFFAMAFLGLWAVRADEVISSTRCRLPGNHRPATIEIAMTRGSFYNDAEPWCGNGEKWEGSFEIRVRAGHKLLSKASLNRLMNPQKPDETLSFWAPKFQLVLREYHGQGHLDFNLGQYATCVNNEYKLFTVHPNGAVAALPFADPSGDNWSGSVFGQGHRNSTPAIHVRHRRLTYLVYKRQIGDMGFYAQQWKWARDKFVLMSSVPASL